MHILSWEKAKKLYRTSEANEILINKQTFNNGYTKLKKNIIGFRKMRKKSILRKMLTYFYFLRKTLTFFTFKKNAAIFYLQERC